MAIANVLAELWPSITQQQGQRVVQAFALTSPPPEGMSNAANAERCLRKFIKSVVMGGDRKTAEDGLKATNAATDAEFGD